MQVTVQYGNLIAVTGAAARAFAGDAKVDKAMEKDGNADMVVDTDYQVTLDNQWWPSQAQEDALRARRAARAVRRAAPAATAANNDADDDDNDDDNDDDDIEPAPTVTSAYDAAFDVNGNRI
jgi:hypothetical protein